MKQTRYITTTVQAGNRLEIDLPNLPIGQTVEVILIIPSLPEVKSQIIDRKSFLKLSTEERNRILEQQAEAALPHYQQNQAEWQEWLNLDIAETDPSQAKKKYDQSDRTPLLQSNNSLTTSRNWP
jgi:hypothetical protein